MEWWRCRRRWWICKKGRKLSTLRFPPPHTNVCMQVGRYAFQEWEAENATSQLLFNNLPQIIVIITIFSTISATTTTRTTTTTTHLTYFSSFLAIKYSGRKYNKSEIHKISQFLLLFFRKAISFTKNQHVPPSLYTCWIWHPFISSWLRLARRWWWKWTCPITLHYVWDLWTAGEVAVLVLVCVLKKCLVVYLFTPLFSEHKGRKFSGKLARGWSMGKLLQWELSSQLPINNILPYQLTRNWRKCVRQRWRWSLKYTDTE